MPENSIPQTVLDRLRENNFDIVSSHDSFRGFKVVAEGSVEEAEELTDEFDHTHVSEKNDRVVVAVSDHLFQ